MAPSSAACISRSAWLLPSGSCSDATSAEHAVTADLHVLCWRRVLARARPRHRELWIESDYGVARRGRDWPHLRKPRSCSTRTYGTFACTRVSYRRDRELLPIEREHDRSWRLGLHVDLARPQPDNAARHVRPLCRDRWMLHG